MHRRMLPLTTLCLAATGALVAACAPGGGTPSGFEAVLAATPATDATVRLVTFSDLEASAELGALDDVGHPYYEAATLGFGGFLGQRAALEALAPIPDEGASALSLGIPPDTAYYFRGVDGDAVSELFAEDAGGRSDLAGGELLVRRDDHAADLQDPLGSFAATELNTVWYDDDSFVAARTESAARALVEPEGESLADAPVYRGVVECLGGDVVGAALTSGDDLPSAAAAFAIATSGTSADDRTQTWCIHAADDADALAEQVSRELAEGSTATGRPWSDLLGETTTEVIDGWVRATAAPEAPGVFVQALFNGDLAATLGR